MDFAAIGDGPVRLLLVPGGPGLDPTFYDELTTSLAKRYRVITFVPRGAWPRETSDFPRTVEEMAEEVAEAVAAAPGEAREDGAPLVILAHSIGTAATLEYLVRSTRESAAGATGQRSVAGAILISPFVSAAMLRDGIGACVAALPQEFHERFAGGAAPAEVSNDLIQQYWFPTHFCRVEWPESYHQAYEHLNSAYLEWFIGRSILDVSGAVTNWNREDDLAGVGVPVLLATGEWDYFRREDIDRMRVRIPDARLVWSARASHSAWLEDPDTLYPEIDRFLNGIVSSKI